MLINSIQPGLTGSTPQKKSAIPSFQKLILPDEIKHTTPRMKEFLMNMIFPNANKNSLLDLSEKADIYCEVNNFAERFTMYVGEPSYRNLPASDTIVSLSSDIGEDASKALQSIEKKLNLKI